jgi:flagellar capping protein FliD
VSRWARPVSTFRFPPPRLQAATTGYAISQTTASWDASGSPATYQLVIDGVSHDILPASNSAADVAAAINSDPTYGAQVQASVVDLGTSTSHDYRISLQSIAEGPATLNLTQAGGPSLQTEQTAATSRSSATWNAAASPAGTRAAYNLVVGSNNYSFTPADSSAASVAAAINSLNTTQVHASVVNLGTTGSPDYRISLQNNTGGAATLDIQRTGTSVQKEQTVGALASYEMNNSGVTATSNTRNITVSTGITATLLGTSTSAAAPTTTLPVDITVTRSTSALGTAISGLADAYNAAVDELGAQRGQSAGALGGNVIVSQLSSLLSSISTYSSNGSINGLIGLGLELGSDGHLTYNFGNLMSAEFSSSTSVTAFLGSTTGGGFLKSATDALNTVEDPTTGLLKTSETDMTAQMAKLTSTIATKQAGVDALQIRLQNQMAASDALIAAMQQQASYFSSMFAAQATADQMYK